MSNPYNILVGISIIIVLSYLFNIISTKLKIPSVLFLLFTGMLLKFASEKLNIQIPEIRLLLELLGVTGLIFIVLEGSLDLTLSGKKAPLIGKAFLSSLFILLATTGILCFILTYFLELPFKTGLLYSIPLGVISSAIAIPSVQGLSEEKREFIIYESTFSDIIGIMFFNFAIQDDISTNTVWSALIDLSLIILISIICSFLILLILNYSRSRAKFYLIFAMLIIIYSIGKMFHLPSLILILFFGLILNNSHLFIKNKIAGYLHPEKFVAITKELKTITAETAFIVRTFFFLLFGYSIQPYLLIDTQVIFIGSLIIAAILFTRSIFLRFISKSNLFPGIFIAPRGLITVVLFYSIPVQYQTPAFNEGILFFVIIASSILMMIGLMGTGSKYSKTIEEIENIEGN